MLSLEVKKISETKVGKSYRSFSNNIFLTLGQMYWMFSPNIQIVRSPITHYIEGL